jgi:hypothetical protein
MGAIIIEPDPQLELILIHPPDNPSTVQEYDREFAEFAASLETLGFEASPRGRAVDAVPPVELGVSLVTAYWVIKAFTPITNTIVIEFGKLLETYLKTHVRKRKGNRFELKIGPGLLTVKGDAEDVVNFIPLLEQLQELFQKERPKKVEHKKKAEGPGLTIPRREVPGRVKIQPGLPS